MERMKSGHQTNEKIGKERQVIWQKCNKVEPHNQRGSQNRGQVVFVLPILRGDRFMWRHYFAIVSTEQ
jgi:hypothetical protein